MPSQHAKQPFKMILKCSVANETTAEQQPNVTQTLE